MRKVSLLLCLLLTCASVLAGRSVQSFSADYRLLFNGDHVGDARFTLQLRENDQYSFESFTRPAGIMNKDDARHEILEASSGSLQGGTPTPAHYYTAVKTADGTRMLEYFYDWENMTLTLKGDDDQEKTVLEKHSQDRLSYLLQAMKLAESHRNSLKTPLITAAGTRQLSILKKNRRFMDSAAGRTLLQELHLSYGIESPDRSLWLSLDHGYMPVLLEQKTEEGIVRMELSKILRSAQ